MVSVTAPVLPPAGAVTTSEVLVADVMVAAVPLNLTELLATTGSKLVPVMVIAVPALAEMGLIVLITGACRYVNTGPVAVPAVVVTVTVPVLPPAGRVAINVLPLDDITVAAEPLNLTVLPAAEASKLEPLMVTDAPANPDEGEIVLMTGAGGGLFFLQPVDIVTIVDKNNRIER